MNFYTSLTKRAVEEYVKRGEIIPLPKDLPEDFLNKRAGVFVILKKEGKLRSIAGTAYPVTNNIAGEIVCNSISAVTNGGELLTESELPFISYEVHILSTPRVVEGLEVLDPKKFGIIVKGVFGKSASLLPNFDAVKTVDEQIRYACKKAGINRTEDDYSLYYFETEKYTE
jgi:AMMECR1 domain-containing protein